ncbi:MAG: hypothetical protein ACRELY_31495 [Polyangiaceae bacterium]
MKWGKTRALVAFAITGTSMASTALTSCSGGDDASTNDTDATYGHQFTDATGSVETSTPVVCAPVLPDAWTPPAFVPPVIDNTACTHQQVSDYGDKCFGSAGGCDSFTLNAANAMCMSCLQTEVGVAPRGAVFLLEDGLYRYNYPGCVAIVDGDFSDNGCAAKQQAISDCQDTACSDTCPIDNSTSQTESDSIAALDACENQSIKSVCASAFTAARCDFGKYAQCSIGNTFEDEVVGVANFMCASGTVEDAGIMDAGNDATDAADISDAADADLDAADY